MKEGPLQSISEFGEGLQPHSGYKNAQHCHQLCLARLQSVYAQEATLTMINQIRESHREVSRRSREIQARPQTSWENSKAANAILEATEAAELTGKYNRVRGGHHGVTTEVKPDVDGQDPYALPKSLGIYQIVDSGMETIESINKTQWSYDAIDSSNGLNSPSIVL